jgi:hypothetical protein
LEKGCNLMAPDLASKDSSPEIAPVRQFAEMNI